MSTTTEGARPGRLLGLDLGHKRIGVAVSDADRRLASGAATLARGRSPADDHAAIAALVADYGATGVVVGVPYSMSGEPGPAAAAALEEAAVLADALSVPVMTVDERLTTVSAAAALRAGGRRARQQRAVIDQTAAAVILQAWMDRDRATGSSR